MSRNLENFRANLKPGTKISWIDTDSNKYRSQYGVNPKNLTGIVFPGTIRQIRDYPSGSKIYDITDDRTGGPQTVTIHEILKPLNGGRKSKKRSFKRKMTRRK